jgi:hypothetical protein
MANQLPCPNPGCTYRFSPAEIKEAERLKCPQCGTVFQFRPAAPAANPPLARPVAKSPASATVETSEPGDRESAPALFDVGKEDALVRVRTVRRKPPRDLKWFLIRGIILVFIVGALAVAYLLRQGARDMLGNRDGAFIINGDIHNLKNVDEKAFRLVLPRNAWKLDNSIKSGLKAIVAVQRSEPETWLAVAAQDFGKRMPRLAEMVQEAMNRLENYFGETLELAEKAEPVDFAGQSAQQLEFKGAIHQVDWRGMCVMFAQHGIAYWFFLAAPTREQADQALKELAGNEPCIHLTDARRGWRPQPPPREIFKGGRYAVSMEAPKGVWRTSPAQDVDEKGALFLFGTYAKEKDNRKNSSVLVLVLKKEPGLMEGLKAARAFIEDRKKGEDEKYRIVPVSAKDDDGGLAMELGDRPGRILDLKVQYGDEVKRFNLLAVADGGEHLFAIRCDCTWESRQIWREDFLELLKTFRVQR